jgi:hypothetical protein
MRNIVAAQMGNQSASLARATSGSIGSIKSISTVGPNGEIQPVVIHADFPNVQVAAEIEQAFNSLLNRAAQYNIPN